MGNDNGLSERLEPQDERDFPNLAATGYRVTGNIEDIRHESEHCFRGSIYGEVVYYMRRRT